MDWTTARAEGALGENMTLAWRLATIASVTTAFRLCLFYKRKKG
jgi:hypothetical protein